MAARAQMSYLRRKETGMRKVASYNPVKASPLTKQLTKSFGIKPRLAVPKKSNECHELSQ